jgi:hypothetical protein
MPTLEADIDAVATVDGVNLSGFQTFDGGEESAEVVDDFPPGAQYADKSVSKAALSNIVIARSWNEARDRPLYNRLKGRTGAAASIGRIVRDENRNPTGQDTFRGKLIRSAGPKGDTSGGTNKAMWELEFATTGLA